MIDALIIRSLLVPAIIHRIGPANWAMPTWLDRIVPNRSIEAADDAPDAPPEDEPIDVPADDDGPSHTPERGPMAGVSS